MVSVDDADFIDERSMYENTDFCDDCAGGGKLSFRAKDLSIQWFVCPYCNGGVERE